MLNIFENIGNPPYDYDLLVKLPEKEYPKYLAKIFYKNTGEKLDLRHPKTFNQKIQWLKLYDATSLKIQLTDKVLVRNWIKEKIGEEYLKPVLWIGKSFDEIPFDELPDKFIIKANHGCKWHFKIKDKMKFLNTNVLVKLVKSRFDGWMNQSFFPFAGFELQYKHIIPQIIIEPLFIEENQEKLEEIEIYCFNGRPKIFQQIKYETPRIISVYDENYNQINLKFLPEYSTLFKQADKHTKLAVNLSDILSNEFKLVRVDWLLHNNKLYFNEMTFTPFSGFYNFEDNNWNIMLGNMLDLSEKGK